jgi:hypothetical protein
VAVVIEQELDVDTGTLLSITTGLFLADDFGAVHHAVEVLRGQPIFTHNLASAGLADELAREAQRQHPWTTDPGLMDDYPALEGSREEIRRVLDEWLARVSARHGSTHRLTAPPETRRVPLIEGLPPKFGGTG